MQHKITIKAKYFQTFVCRIKRSLGFRYEYENSKVWKYGRKSKLTARTKRKLKLLKLTEEQLVLI